MSDLSLGKWISLLYRYGQIYITRELEPYHVGRGQYLFLLALYHQDSMQQEELSHFLNIDKGTTARAVCKMEKAGYVRREQSSTDLRSNRVYLTEQAEKIKPHVFAVLARWVKILSTEMTEAEVETTTNLLARMSQNAIKHINKEKV